MGLFRTAAVGENTAHLTHVAADRKCGVVNATLRVANTIVANIMVGVV